MVAGRALGSGWEPAIKCRFSPMAGAAFAFLSEKTACFGIEWRGTGNGPSGPFTLSAVRNGNGLFSSQWITQSVSGNTGELVLLDFGQWRLCD